MDVLFDAATIELKRLETYACERMSDACCWRARILLFMLVPLCRYDYCFSGFAKSALPALHTIRGKRKQEYSLTKLWRSALRRSKTHRERVGKISL